MQKEIVFSFLGVMVFVLSIIAFGNTYNAGAGVAYRTCVAEFLLNPDKETKDEQ